MIVTEDTPQSPVKDSTPLLRGGPSGPSGPSAPPAYSPPPPAGPTHYAAASAPGPYVVYQPVYPQQSRPGESAGPRFFKAFLVAVGLWFLASFLLGSILDERTFSFDEYPIPSDVRLNDCISGWEKDSGYSAETSFEFGVPEETLLLLSKGSLSGGHLRILSEPTDTVRVHITMSYYSRYARDTVKVCRIGRGDGEGGVGIFTPSRWRRTSPRDSLRFDVTLTLPAHEDVHALSTDVNNFSHELGQLKDVVNFNSISLKGSNGAIFARSLAARTAALSTSNGAISFDVLSAASVHIHSSNAPVSGEYAVTDVLDIRTSNGVVKVDVDVNAKDGTAKKAAEVVKVRTSNAPIYANVALSSSNAQTFPITFETSNNQLLASVSSLPSGSTLKVSARTSNGPAELTLPPTYEGTLRVETSNAPPSIIGNEGRRSLEIRTRGKRLVEGNIYWDKANREKGKAELRTSNGKAVLHI